MIFCLDGHIGRIDAAIMFVLFIFFMVTTVKGVKTGEQNASGPQDKNEAQPAKEVNTVKAVIFIILGLVCLILGSSVFVDNASAIAKSLGVSDAVIGLTIVAGGTSLPELATSVVAARKGNSGIAIGNVLGSNVFNILMILGITGLIAPMTLEGITNTDLSVMVLSIVLLWLFSYTKLRIQRWEGAVLAASFIAYVSWLISQAV